MVDDLNINHFDPAELRSYIAYIPQNVVLFHGSIRDNIVMSAPNIDDETLLRAIKLSGVDQFINQHPDGIDRAVGERGQFLSGGQQQTIAIARGILLDPAIYIFDEPTHSLDNFSTKQFLQKMPQVLKNKTFILVSHKANVLELVDRLIILDAGKIIADGPREEISNRLKNINTAHNHV